MMRKLGFFLFAISLPVALAGAYLRDAFKVWEESGSVLYMFAGVYLFAAALMITETGKKNG